MIEDNSQQVTKWLEILDDFGDFDLFIREDLFDNDH